MILRYVEMIYLYIYNMKQALPGKLAKLITNQISCWSWMSKHMQNFMLMYI